MSEKYRPPTRRTILCGALAALASDFAHAADREPTPHERTALEQDAELVRTYAQTATHFERKFPDVVERARPWIAESKAALEKAYWWADMLRHRKRVGASHASIVDAKNWIRVHRHTARVALNKVPNEFHTFTQLQTSEPKKPEKKRRTRKRRRR